MQDSEVKVQVDFKGIKKLVEAMSREYSVKVGLLASKGGSEEISKDLDLAGLGAVQEYGAVINVTPKMRAWFRYRGINLKKDTNQIVIPARSFLKMPLERTKELMKKIRQAFGRDTIDYVALTGDLYTLALAVGMGAQKQILEAFETAGFGEWAPDSPLTSEWKGSGKPLEDTGKLKQSITYEVEKNG